MTCREAIGVLGAYHDGELSAVVRVQVDAHLGACAECATYLRTYRDTVKLAKDAVGSPDDASSPDLPDDLVATILSARPKP
jgi:anti-sigma factor RsiW